MNIPLLLKLRGMKGAFVPMVELGDDLDQLRVDLEALEAFGYLLERHPYYGVAYRGPAERLCPDQIEFGLATKRVGRRIAVWSRVSSTNDLAARAASSPANDGLVVLAEEQWAGRGRRGRSWSAPPRSSLLLSVLLYPPETLAATPWLTALGAVAAAEVVAEAAGVDARIKWPNDVRVDGKKVAGILVERGPAAVVGIGINVNVPSDGFPPELRATATSLQVLNGAPLDRSELVRTLLRRLDYWYDLGLAEGSATLNLPWRARSEHLGRTVEVTTGLGALVGRLDDLDFDRGAMLTCADGTPHRIELRDLLSLTPVAPQEAASD
jgi:BirA family biotin operon repressor/biotin-[acetyl-CoA-carboxylase] ligase